MARVTNLFISLFVSFIAMIMTFTFDHETGKGSSWVTLKFFLRHKHKQRERRDTDIESVC